MSSKAEPNFVVCNEKEPAGRNYFQWDDEKLIKWKNDAICLQDAHVRDNNQTKWFKYNSIIDQDSLELRVLIAIYGVRTPQVKYWGLKFVLSPKLVQFLSLYIKNDCKSAPFCTLNTYDRSERLQARKLIKIIVKNSKDSREIYMNIVYVSTATKNQGDKKEEFYASEIPCKN